VQGKMITIKVDGTITEQAFDRVPTLEELKAAVGGWLELVPRMQRWHGKPCVAFCDEEGKLKQRPINELATAAWAFGGYDVICGDVVILTGDRDFLDGL